MSEQTHAPEPWMVTTRQRHDVPYAIVSQRAPYESLLCVRDIDGDRMATFLNSADVERTVQCVNACAGIDDPADLRRQRDALMEAAREAIDTLQYLRKHVAGLGLSAEDDADDAIKALTEAMEDK